MDSEQPLESQATESIHGSIETIMQVLEQLPPSIELGAAQLVQCLLNEKKILCCGLGSNAALSQLFTGNLLNRFHYERPSLPVVNLNAEAAVITAIATDSSFHDIYSHQIRALGQPGDVLLLIANNSANPLLQAIQSAHDREMTVVALNNLESPHISALLQPEDTELTVPSSNRARTAEAHLLIIHCLCELIDQQLFGGF